jgi:CubicO group peptidase (beta-lactamase class C family)
LVPVPGTFAQALRDIETWPVPSAGAAVVTADLTVNHGQTSAIQRIASVTKPLFAYAVLIAVEEGTLALDEPAGPLGSTVRHLLAHASGLPFELSEATANTGAATGTRRVYSNVGFDVLGALLESRAQMTAADYLHLAVFEPLCMTQSVLRGSVAKDVHSNVEELALFARELLRPTLVAPETWRAMTTVQYPELAGVIPGLGTYRPCPWGLGVEIRGRKTPHWTGNNNSPTTFGHFGGTGSMFWADPEADVALVALTGREFGPWAPPLWQALSDDVLSALPSRKLPKHV